MSARGAQGRGEADLGDFGHRTCRTQGSFVSKGKDGGACGVAPWVSLFPKVEDPIEDNEGGTYESSLLGSHSNSLYFSHLGSWPHWM